MSDTPSTPLTSQDAFRLARFLHPELDPANIQAEDDFPQHAVWSEEIIHGEQGDSITLNIVFRIDSLDDLALAEQRVVAAGLGCELTGRVLAFVPIPEGHKWTQEGSLLAAYTATAEQRARALLALLDAHPELEKPQ